jgi:Protein of unknown function (DUF2950)
MMTNTNKQFACSAGVALLAVVALLVAGCARKTDHASFDSADAAVSALTQALGKDDTAALRQLFGPGSDELLSSGDAVQDKSDRAAFLAALNEKHSLVADGNDAFTLVIGAQDWPFPVPVTSRDGRWYLDGSQGTDELVYRRIGANELGAIAVSRGFVAAQVDYAAEGRDGDSAGIYALKLISDQGQHNGLYWPTTQDEPASPAGPFVAAAAAEGYRSSAARLPYHGYYYRILYRQGENANGGSREYFKNGLLTEGFALVAWPADYQVSGVMTFIVDQDGVVFQHDRCENTAATAAAMMSFDPDSSWVAVTDSSGT